MVIKGGPYSTIDEATAAKIKELHRKYPRLGHRGLRKALNEMSVKVDSKELERFMYANRIKAKSPFRPRPLKGLPPYLTGTIASPGSEDGGIG